MKKSLPLTGDRPNWYLGLKTGEFGDYYGSQSSVAKGETYVTHDKRYIVHRNAEGAISVRFNVCAHAGAPLLDTPGVQNGGNIQCPIHKWTYKPTGELLAAPYFHHAECKDISLAKPDFGMWNGYVLGFAQDELDAALAGFGESVSLPAESLNPSEFVFMGEEVYKLPYPRQLMMINYFDGYHVPLCHQKTFDAVADANSYEWELGKEHSHGGRCNYSIQVVRGRHDVRKHMDRLLRVHQCKEEELGWAHLHEWLKATMPEIETPLDRDIFAVWASIYGNGYLMPELYQGGLLLAVSYLVSQNGEDSETENLNLVEYYVHKNVPERLRTVAFRKFRDAYRQSGEEDDEICLKLWEAHSRGSMEFSRVYHELLEAGDEHWRNWFRGHFVLRS